MMFLNHKDTSEKKLNTKNTINGKFKVIETFYELYQKIDGFWTNVNAYYTKRGKQLKHEDQEAKELENEAISGNKTGIQTGLNMHNDNYSTPEHNSQHSIEEVHNLLGNH